MIAASEALRKLRRGKSALATPVGLVCYSVGKFASFARLYNGRRRCAFAAAESVN